MEQPLIIVKRKRGRPRKDEQLTDGNVKKSNIPKKLKTVSTLPSALLSSLDTAKKDDQEDDCMMNNARLEELEAASKDFPFLSKEEVAEVINSMGVAQIRNVLKNTRKAWEMHSLDHMFYPSQRIPPDFRMTREQFMLHFVVEHHRKRHGKEE
jgi:hypothetical protein